MRWAWIGLVLLSAAAPAFAQSATYVFTALGYQQLSITSTSALQLTVPNGARIAQICTESNPVRYRSDTTPTTTVGMPVLANTCFQYSGALTTQQNLNPVSGTEIIEFIAVSTTATLDIDYFK
jgi:hypothetical protein